MRTVNIHDAKTHLSRLIEAAAAGETTIIAKAGKPIAKLVPIGLEAGPCRIGFLNGKIAVPDDFDRMAGAEIIDLFENGK